MPGGRTPPSAFCGTAVCLSGSHERVNTPEDREAFDKLCRAYIEARYNRLFTVSEEQYEYMLARTEALREVTIRECAARIAYYDKMIEKEERYATNR